MVCMFVSLHYSCFDAVTKQHSVSSFWQTSTSVWWTVCSVTTASAETLLAPTHASVLKGLFSSRSQRPVKVSAHTHTHDNKMLCVSNNDDELESALTSAVCSPVFQTSMSVSPARASMAHVVTWLGLSTASAPTAASWTPPTPSAWVRSCSSSMVSAN